MLLGYEVVIVGPLMMTSVVGVVDFVCVCVCVGV